jgi:hypothetical protein
MAEQPATRSRWPGSEKWCFMPARGLVFGDMLLAQKTALETMEQEAFASRIASRILMRTSSQVDAITLRVLPVLSQGLAGSGHVDP